MWVKRFVQKLFGKSKRKFTITAYDLDKFLRFLSSIGFSVDIHSHATLGDFSEQYFLTLSLAGREVASLSIHYIDNHFWPKEPMSREESLARIATPRMWGVIVEPVTITIEASANIPMHILNALRSYSDSLPPHPQAKRAYEQYKAGR